MILLSSCGRLCPILWSHVLSREWRCSSWSSADRRCPNYIWVIDNLIVYRGASYIRDLTSRGVEGPHVPCHGPTHPTPLTPTLTPGTLLSHFFYRCFHALSDKICCHKHIPGKHGQNVRWIWPPQKNKNKNVRYTSSNYHRKIQFTSKYMFPRAANTIRLVNIVYSSSKGSKYKMVASFGKIIVEIKKQLICHYL